MILPHVIDIATAGGMDKRTWLWDVGFEYEDATRLRDDDTIRIGDRVIVDYVPILKSPLLPVSTDSHEHLGKTRQVIN